MKLTVSANRISVSVYPVISYSFDAIQRAFDRQMHIAHNGVVLSSESSGNSTQTRSLLDA